MIKIFTFALYNNNPVMGNNLKVVIFSSSLHDSSTLLDTREALLNELRSEHEVELIDSSEVESSLAGEDLDKYYTYEGEFFNLN